MITNMMPSEIFRGRKAITTQGFIEGYTKLGQQYEASALFQDVSSGSQLMSLFTTGPMPVSLKSRSISYTGSGIISDIYRSPKYESKGDPLDYENSTDIDPIEGSMTIEGDVVLGAGGSLGTKVFASDILIGNESNQGKGSSGSKLVSERILRPNTEYLFVITSQDPGTQDIASFVSWHEGDLDLPKEIGEF